MTVTRLVTTPDSGSTPNATGAFTPTVNDLLIVVLTASASVSDADDVPTVSANGITFVRAVHGLASSSVNSVDIYVANQLVPSSPVSMTVSWAPTDVGTSTVIDVYAVTGMSRTGTSAIKQVANTDNGTAGGTPAATFPANCLTGNITIVSVANLSAPAGVTEPSSWTEINDTSCSTPTAGLEVAYRLSGFTAATVTWGSTSATAFGAVAVELDTSAGTTPVGKELQTIWDVRAPIGDPLQTIWDVRAALGDTVQAIWDVRQAVGDPVDLQWDVRAALGDPLQLVWDVNQAVGDPLELRWNVETLATAVGKDLGLVWNLSAAVGDPLQLVWNLSAAVGDDAQLVWDTRAAVAQTNQLVWDIRTFVGDAVELQWQIRTPVGKDGQYLWDLKQAVGDILQLVWDVIGDDPVGWNVPYGSATTSRTYAASTRRGVITS